MTSAMSFQQQQLTTLCMYYIVVVEYTFIHSLINSCYSALKRTWCICEVCSFSEVHHHQILQYFTVKGELRHHLSYHRRVEGSHFSENNYSDEKCDLNNQVHARNPAGPTWTKSHGKNLLERDSPLSSQTKFS